MAKFLCKVCGAASPPGIGYVGEPVAAHPAPDCPNPHANPNADRAERAYRLILIYRQWAGQDEDEETLIVDLLADLMHLADEGYGEWPYMLERATMHYEAERVNA